VASFDDNSHNGASDEDDDATDASASDDDTSRVNLNHVQVRVIQVPVIAPAAATPIRRAAHVLRHYHVHNHVVVILRHLARVPMSWETALRETVTIL
jgi:hypothetical protein